MSDWGEPYNILGFVGGVVLAGALLPQIYLAHKRGSCKDISYGWQVCHARVDWGSLSSVDSSFSLVLACTAAAVVCSLRPALLFQREKKSNYVLNVSRGKSEIKKNILILQ